MIKVKVETNKVIAEINTKSKRLVRKAHNATYKAGQMTQRMAKQKAPVDTSALREMISLESNKSASQISVKVDSPVKTKRGDPYGVYQEFGTRYQPGTPHIRPAFYVASNWWKGELKRIL